MNVISDEIIELKAKLLGSLLLFTQTFYKIRTGREFVLSSPVSRETHEITICKELTKVKNLETQRLLINIPPGHGKSELCIHFVAWCIARYPDSQFLYISYSHDLAARHTHTIKQIIELAAYRKIFGVEVSRDSSAKDNFKTNFGGTVRAYGSSGSITGQDAGLPNLERFSGCVLMDDMHKPDEVHSDSIRGSIIKNYNETIKPRLRADNVPMIFIGQRLHEDDLPAFLIAERDGYNWIKVILSSIDEAGNVLSPQKISKERLLIEKKTNEYVFSAQYQQNPQPAGGGIFKPEWFHTSIEEPNIFATFITVDTAETDKTYNDATVFSFWGIHKIIQRDIDTGLYGLQWLDCQEIRIEPKDLEAELLDFYSHCMAYKTKPRLIAIEKKSTGVTLISVLRQMQGLHVMDIERTRASGNKTSRYLEIQRYVASRCISFPLYAKHMKMCVEHCRKITANDTHAHDDIADTLYDAIKIALIDKTIILNVKSSEVSDKVISALNADFNKSKRVGGLGYGGREVRVK